MCIRDRVGVALFSGSLYVMVATGQRWLGAVTPLGGVAFLAVSYTHLRAHETPEHLVCRLLLEKKK